MKRNMELVRKILLKIEDEYKSTALTDLSIDGYDMETVAYHCSILYDADLISFYHAQYADNKLWSFNVGNLTWEGHDFLDKIRDDSQWHKVTETITKKGLPMLLETIKAISTAFVTSATETVVSAIIKNGGMV